LSRDKRHLEYSYHAANVRAQGLEPGLEQLRIGKRHVENPFLAPARVGLRSERKGERERRVAVTLGELARKQRAPVRAAHVRDVFLEEVFLDHVGEHVEKASRGAGHVSGEFGGAFLAHLEKTFPLQLTLRP